MKIFIYVLFDIREPEHYRYAGKATDVKTRIIKHRSESLRNNRTKKERWIFKVLKEGSDIDYIVLMEKLRKDSERRKKFH